MTDLNPDMTMQQILDAFPGARRALFQRYHIGGCSSCGFEPQDTLRRVLANHGVGDVQSALDVIKQFDELDRRMQIQPSEVATLLQNGNPRPRVIDVRSEEEREIASIDGSELLTERLVQELKALPRDTQMIFFCHRGMRSLDAAAWFAGHGFKSVRSMTGGIDAWSAQVDPSVARY